MVIALSLISFFMDPALIFVHTTVVIYSATDFYSSRFCLLERAEVMQECYEWLLLQVLRKASYGMRLKINDKSFSSCLFSFIYITYSDQQ